MCMFSIFVWTHRQTDTVIPQGLSCQVRRCNRKTSREILQANKSFEI
jgi:hypothetical protein